MENNLENLKKDGYTKTMHIASLNLDTYKVVKLLQSKGYTKKEAEGFIEAIQEITLSGVATGQDIATLNQEIQSVRQEIQSSKDETKKAIQELFKFQLIQTIALIGVMVALFQYF